MKKYLAAALLTFSAVYTVTARGTDWAEFSRYETANAEVAAQPDNARRVVFMGNSITDMWPATHPEFFTRHGFIGRGISGQTTYQFLSRFRRDVIELNPRVVVINAATNDIAENTHPYNEDITFGNIVSMVELAKANGIEVVLTTTLPAASFSWNGAVTDAPEKIRSLNRRLATYAAEHRIPFVDYYSHMLAPDGKSLDPRYTRDGVHPTAAGYGIMEDLILKVLE